jgi:tRNA 5-methylaminomethyl-2-thiouridine biosynthesis bifunctional protein
MSEPVDWGDDGTPRSPRFDDIYRPADGGLLQARAVFLGGCGLPLAWAGQARWRILETGFGLGLNFLAAWRAWRDDPARPAMLHYVSIEAWPVSAGDLLRSVAGFPELQELAAQLARQWWGLVPGLHRLAFEEGRVLLTLCVGDVEPMLRDLAFRADCVFLDGFEPQRNPAMWSAATFKGVARLCRRGTRFATWTAAGDVRRDLQACGFRVEKVDGLPPKRHRLQGVFEPAWRTADADAGAPLHATRAVVIGAGLAGAAVAASLARRGWEVEVLDRHSEPAAGASSLPAGLMAPHQSPDDNLLSQLSRSGIRLTLQQAEALLPRGQDWEASGAIEVRLDDPRPPPALGPGGEAWTTTATPEQKVQALVDAGTQAWWHQQAAWIKPAALVRAWLAQSSIRWRGGVTVASVRKGPAGWQLLDDAGSIVAESAVVVLAAAGQSAGLLGNRIALTPVRGQVSWGERDPSEPGWPAFPLNGDGHLLPAIPQGDRLTWLAGSSYGRGDTGLDVREAEQEDNLHKLATLAPHLARRLRPAFEAGRVKAWTGTRWASRDRRPLVGWVEPGLGVSTAMGSRGLTFAVLCAELLAARLHDEPLPLPRRQSAALDALRHNPAT